MAGGSFNVAELLRQLGLKSVHELPIAPSVQPVLVAGDASGLTPPLLPPTAWAGATIGAVIGQLGGLQVQSLGVGGCWVRQCLFAVGQTTVIPFAITAADPIAGGYATVLTKNEMAPDPTVSVVRVGNDAAALAVGDSPQWRAITSTTVPLIDAVYVPHGWFFTIQNANSNQISYASVMIQEVPAAALSAQG